MGIRMLHRRKAHARVHVTATADTQVDPGAARRRRPRPALAPGAATPRLPRTPVTVLRAAAARLPRPAALTRLLPRGDSLRRWAGAARGFLALALGVLGRLPRPGTARTVRRIPVFVATATPLTERPDGSAPH
ncbi:hypothetical protein [Streptomyces sp. NPDC050263]|uniref:hypothetical protein n=1 Tax=Streptomyces sp. NPDC050263 TaxID=3155037 RepID=UPI003416D7E9